MQTIKFLGASSGIVTGSGYLLSDDSGHGIIIDMGMFQGSEKVESHNYEPLSFDPREVHSVLLTHAHLDHVGRLPMLVRHGFQGKIYSTKATKELAEVVMYDSAKINSLEEEKPLLYTEEDVRNTLQKFEVVKIDDEFEISSIKVKYKNAGHILGSASIIIKDGKKRIIFSGDLGNSPQLIEKPTQMIDKGDIVIMESTYGDRNHPKESPEEAIKSEINKIEQSQSTLLIPSFSIERTQVLLHLIKMMKKRGEVKRDTVVYLDSPMAIRATDIYKSFKNLYSEKLSKVAQTSDPFDFPGLKITRSSKESKKINRRRGAKVIIAGSGMMNGGRILHHAKAWLPNSKTRLLIVGFQAEDTLGREIVEGAESVDIDGQEIPINASLTELYSMSAHADQKRLLTWIKSIHGIDKVYLTHGEDPQRNALKEKITKETGIESIDLPVLNEVFRI